MPSPDTVPFTLSESDAHMAHQNTQQVIESIMQALLQLLKKLMKEKEKEPLDKPKEPQADEEKVISLPELAEPPVIEPVNIQQQTLQLDGADPNLLSAAPPYELEGQELQGLLPADSVERLQTQALLVAIRIEVEETAVVGSVLGEDGSDLREALAQLSPEQLEQVREAVERSAQADDIIDVESETVKIDGWIEDEGQVEYLSLAGREQEVERTPLDSAAQESLGNSLETAGYDIYENLYQNEIEPDLKEQPEIVPPWEEKPEPIRTEQLSVEQVESWTGNDFGNSPHLDDVGTVIAQVDDHGRILDKGYVLQQVESRVEDAELEDEIDEQRSAGLESSPTAADRQAAATISALLETVESDHFEGDRYLIEQKGDITSVMATDGRGLLLMMEGENILESHLEPHDIAQLQQGNEVLAQYAADKDQAVVEAPIAEPLSLDRALEPIAAGFELN